MSPKPIFLIRSLTEQSGYSERIFPTGKLPQTREESYVPWAMVKDQVVYAPTGMHNSWRGGGGLRPYDTSVSQQRRRVCESALGLLSLSKPLYYASAVNKVSAGVREYLKSAYKKNPRRTADVVNYLIGEYFFTGGQEHFGRLSNDSRDKWRPKDLFNAIMSALKFGRAEQKLAIHDMVGWKLLPHISGGPNAVYDSWHGLAGHIKEVKNNVRGRVLVRPRPSGNAIAGTLLSSEAHLLPAMEHSRVRAVEEFTRDLSRMRNEEMDDFYDELDTRNLTYVCNPSGTTGSLLQAAIAFGRLAGEPLKEYMFAILGYLIGGGFHSFHECMVIAQKVGIRYIPGEFFRSLPDSFTHSPEYRAWSGQYYDVVHLGGIHWRYNAGVLPSHLNSQLQHSGTNKTTPSGQGSDPIRVFRTRF